jgi:hypothetical protein
MGITVIALAKLSSLTGHTNFVKLCIAEPVLMDFPIIAGFIITGI